MGSEGIERGDDQEPQIRVHQSYCRKSFWKKKKKQDALSKVVIFLVHTQTLSLSSFNTVLLLIKDASIHLSLPGQSLLLKASARTHE